MVLGISEDDYHDVRRLNLQDSRRSGTNYKFLDQVRLNQAFGAKDNQKENSTNKEPELLKPLIIPASVVPQANVTPRLGDSPVKTIQRSTECRQMWQSKSCAWGNERSFRHEVKAISSPPARRRDNVSSTDSGTAEPPNPVHATSYIQIVASPTPFTPGTTATLNQVRKRMKLLRHAKYQVNAARLAGGQEEAAHNEQEEAVCRERQLQLARERELEKRKKIAQRRKQRQELAEEAAVTIQQVILGCFVRFGAGLAIQCVVCGFETSKVLIKNIPKNANECEIVELFTQQGVNEQDFIVLEVESSCQQATVLGKATDMEAVGLKLNGMEFCGRTLESVVCEQPSVGQTIGSSVRHLHHLTISWCTRLLTMVARFPYLDAWEVSQRARVLDGQLWNGQRIRAECEEDRGLLVSGDDYIPPSQKVRISRIPFGTTVAEIQTLAGTQNIEPHVNASTYTSNEIFTVLNVHLRGSPNPTLRTLTLENSPRAHSASAKATFTSWEGVKSAYDDLSDRVFGHGFPPLQLLLSDSYGFVLVLDEKQYIAQKTQWTELCCGKDRQITIQTTAVDGAYGRKAIVTLSGHDKKVVDALKVRIESMTAGQRLDGTFWHPTFKSAEGQEFLDGLYSTTGAYVHADQKCNCVVISGKAEAIEAAKVLLREEVERLSAEHWNIPLERRALDFFVREGLARMKGLLGEENVALDTEACQILLHGVDPEEARHHFRHLMDTFEDHDTVATTLSRDTLCPVCHNTISQPISIGCKHICCLSCLHHYILSALNDYDFPLKCVGSDATCNRPLSLPLIKQFLPPHRFEQLMEAALTSYISKNPKTFRYCSTPDCSQVYRVTPLPHEFQCPSCFSQVCTACHHEGHAGTCAEMQVYKGPREQERLLGACPTANGVKRCPFCCSWVEENGGSGYMTCKCGVHCSCRICMRILAADTHMSQVHGGYNTSPRAAEDNNVKRCPFCRSWVEENRASGYMTCKCGVHCCCRICMRILAVDTHVSQVYGDYDMNPRAEASQKCDLQPRDLVPRSVRLGGPAIVTEQMAEPRSIELQRTNRAPPCSPSLDAQDVPKVYGTVAQPLPTAADPRTDQAERRRQEQLQEVHGQQEAEDAERQHGRVEDERREMEHRVRPAAEQQTCIRVTEEGEREAEGKKGRCTIM